MIERIARSKVEPKAKEIFGDKVLVNTNPREVTVEDSTLWEYDQKQYTKDEYIKSIDDENKELEGVVSDLTDLLINKGVIY